MAPGGPRTTVLLLAGSDGDGAARVCAGGNTGGEHVTLSWAGQPTVCLQPGEWMRLLKPLRVEASRVVDSKNHNVTLNRRDGRQACQLRSRPIACGQVPREWLFPDRGGRWGVGFRRLALPTNDSAVWEWTGSTTPGTRTLSALTSSSRACKPWERSPAHGTGRPHRLARQIVKSRKSVA